MFNRVISAFIVVVMVCQTAHAQVDAVTQMLDKISGTMSVYAAPEMADGKLSGCSLVFEAMQRDYKYLSGNFVKVTGTIGFLAAGKNVATVLKVIAGEIDPALEDLFAGSLKVSRAYLVGGDLRTNFDSLINAAPTDNDGLFSIFQIDPSMDMILQGALAGTITFAFALGDGSSDIQTTLELNVVDVDEVGTRKRSADTQDTFLNCTQQLLESVTQ
ncbi:MAG: hypothetical protein EOP62_22560 [Sphingomonadales bacterium]|nr:MAG: hypothetical protein EOP62_22560 [Sphingomonadales bacterium]